MSIDAIQEARRQTEICNACRYCEGFCSVFPALTRQKAFADGDISHLANLCHNCRGCYYSCQYTEPHEFALNFPDSMPILLTARLLPFSRRPFCCRCCLLLSACAAIGKKPAARACNCVM